MNMNKIEHPVETIAGEFKRLDGLRQDRLDASKHFAYYTIPSVFPEQDDEVNANTSRGLGMLDSIGSTVVNHFANKLVNTLFSPNRPFFRLTPNSEKKAAKAIAIALDSENPNEAAQARNGLDKLRTKFARTEKAAIKYLEKIGYRTTAVAAAKLLIITGDTIIRNTINSKSVAYSMRDYVVTKDISGNDLIIIIKDSVAFATLDKEMQQDIMKSDAGKQYSAHSPVIVYTKMSRETDMRFVLTQAADNFDLPKTDAKRYTENDLPYTHISWNLSKGEDYGRGLVEDFGGSFHMIDHLSDALTRVASRLSDVKIFVDPRSGIDINDLNSAEAGTYVAGKAGDTGIIGDTTGQNVDFLANSIQLHKRQVATAFLYRQGAQREAERVTAEEIREDVAELELAHGGVYSRFSSEWQAKVARVAVASIGERLGKNIEPQIITGLDSLSRSGEMQSIRAWVDDLALLNNVPEDVRAGIDLRAYGKYAAINRGIEPKVFMKTDQQLQQEQEAAQQQQQQLLQQEQQSNDQQAITQAALQQ